MTEALITTHSGALALTSDEMNTLRKTICKDLDDNEIKLFVAFCAQRKLHPLAKHVYPFKSGGRLAFITSIDAMRTIAHRSGQYDGSEGPYWCGGDGKWVDVWLGRDKPLAAKFVDYRKDCSHPFVGIILAAEYQGQAVSKAMPTHMLAKAAEAIAHRKAFPEDLGGMYEKDEMPNNLEIDVTPERPPPPASRLTLDTATKPNGVQPVLVNDDAGEVLLTTDDVREAPPTDSGPSPYATPTEALKALRALTSVGLSSEDIYALLGGDRETFQVDVDHVLVEDLARARQVYKQRKAQAQG